MASRGHPPNNEGSRKRRSWERIYRYLKKKPLQLKKMLPHLGKSGSQDRR